MKIHVNVDEKDDEMFQLYFPAPRVVGRLYHAAAMHVDVFSGVFGVNILSYIEENKEAVIELTAEVVE